MSRPAPRMLSNALGELTATIAPATTLARIQGIWEHTVGVAISSSAQPAGEHEGVLTVTCAAAVWAQELDLMADALIPRLNDALGDQAINKLRCRTG